MSRNQLALLLFAGITSALFCSPGRAAGEELRGVIASVDPAKNELRVEGRGSARGEAVVFALDDKTLVLFGSEKGKPADLVPGRRVRVEFDETPDGKRIARVVKSAGRPASARATPAAPAAPALPGDAVTGVLQRVARADREVVIVGPGAKGAETETTIAVPEGTKIVKDGKPVALDALKEGDSAAIRTEQKDGRLTAVEVQVGQGATLSSQPPTERGRMIPRLRQALHMADEVLRQIEGASGDQPPGKP